MDQNMKNQDTERTHNRPVFIPVVDIFEKENSIVVVADMPGVEEKNIQVNFEKGVLTVSGHIEEKTKEGFRSIYNEYHPVGDYERSFTVPDAIDVEKIEGHIKNGLLTVVLPRSPKPEARKIPIKIS
jgi:HSP20 family molecular chaperone IbpA